MSLRHAFKRRFCLAAGPAQAAEGAVTAPQSVWLGHFSGGRNRDYSLDEGFETCAPIR